ncbi:MAG: deoxyribodipyrimidine photo-lyase [bacterium]
MKPKANICLLKRDLRVEDNRTLYQCYMNSEKILPIFVFDKDVLKSVGIEELSDHRLSFLLDIIENLRKQIKLYVFVGNDQEAISRIIERYDIKALYTSKPLTFSGKHRNQKIKEFLKYRGIQMIEVLDNVLCDYTKIPYRKVYTYFYNEWKNYLDLEMVKDVDYNTKIIHDEFLEDLTRISIQQVKSKIKNTTIWTYEFGINRIKEYDFSKYEELRNDLGIDYSSKLSPYIRFGVLSIRKVYNLAKDKSIGFIKELAWREFWYHIAHYFPELPNLEFQERRRNIAWENNEKYIDSIEKAQTGYPIIDACIIQLKRENWMHNRARLIFGSFLTKDLLTDWRIGEKIFSKYLIDYDEVVNLGNWQWISSVGPDPKPLRIFNPILQAQKFDPFSKFIKKYLPQLSNMEPHKLHDPLSNKLNYYPPIVNHHERIEKIKQAYS